MLINILIGKQSKIKDYMCDYPEFCSGNFYGGEKWWKDMLRCMLNDELIQESQAHGAFFTTLGLTSKGVKKRNAIVAKYPSYAKLDIAKSSRDVEGADNSSGNSSNNSYDSIMISYPKIVAEEKITKSKTRAIKSTKSTGKTIKTTDKTLVKNTVKNTDKAIIKPITSKAQLKNIRIIDSDEEPDVEADSDQELKPFAFGKKTETKLTTQSKQVQSKQVQSKPKTKSGFMQRSGGSDEDIEDELDDLIGNITYESALKKKFGIGNSDSD
jgi:hypothetical protein